MYIPKDGHLCWIASVTKLPNFYDPGTIISCMFCGETGEEYFPISRMKVYQGRDIRIPFSFNKYKLEMQCMDTRYDIVGLSDAPYITMSDIQSNRLKQYRFFPVYIHAGNDCLLFTESINDYFAMTGSASLHDPLATSAITSTAGIIDKIDELINGSLRHQGIITDDNIALSNVKRNISIPALAMMIATGDTSPYSSDVVDYHQAIMQLLPPQTPDTVKLFSNVRQCSDLRFFVNQYYGLSTDIANAAIFDESRFTHIRDTLIKNDALPLYSEEINLWECDYESFVGRLLNGVFGIAENNFVFTMNKSNDFEVAEFCQTVNVRGDFQKSFAKMENKNLLYYLHAAFDLNKRSNYNRFTVTRSWYEDLVVKEPDTGKIILYIDLVPWMLAGAEGLINLAGFEQMSIF